MKTIVSAAITCAAVLSISLCAMGQSIPRAGTTPGAPISPTTGTGTNPLGNRGRGEACWKKAGISQSTVERRRSINEETRSKVEGVCRETALTPQQKEAQIREIRQNARREEQGLITPEQRISLEECQRAMHPAAGTGIHPGGGARPHQGPCEGVR